MNSPYRRRQIRKPQRLTITIPQSTFERIESVAEKQGRSLSNLSSYLLERALEEIEE